MLRERGENIIVRLLPAAVLLRSSAAVRGGEELPQGHTLRESPLGVCVDCVSTAVEQYLVLINSTKLCRRVMVCPGAS